MSCPSQLFSINSGREIVSTCRLICTVLNLHFSTWQIHSKKVQCSLVWGHMIAALVKHLNIYMFILKHARGVDVYLSLQAVLTCSVYGCAAIDWTIPAQCNLLPCQVSHTHTTIPFQNGKGTFMQRFEYGHIDLLCALDFSCSEIQGRF